jgi:autoinducer 2-degrading protein
MAYALAITLRSQDGEAETFRRVLAEITGPSREEEGNLVFETHQSPDDENAFFVYESYTDAAAYDVHLATPMFKRVETELFPLLADRNVQIYDTLDPIG